MSAHTPGPWHAREWDFHAKTSVGINGGPLGFIHIAECGGMGHYPDISPEQEDANAQLIAAAPEMLAALEALLMATEWSIESRDERAAAEAAIAKAKGQS